MLLLLITTTRDAAGHLFPQSIHRLYIGFHCVVVVIRFEHIPFFLLTFCLELVNIFVAKKNLLCGLSLENAVVALCCFFSPLRAVPIGVVST